MAEDVKLYLKIKNGAEGFSDVTVEESIFKKPTLLCCSGVNSTHNDPQFASGFIKRAEALINTTGVEWIYKPFQLAAVTYDPALTGSDVIRDINMGVDKNYYQAFVDREIKPLMVDEEGKRLSVEDVCHHFRNIQILAFSYGTLFVQQVGNLVVKEMEGLGYTPEDIKQATEQVLVVAAGPAANFGKGKASFTTINVLHGKDSILPENSYNVDFAKHLAEESGRTGDYFACGIDIKSPYDYSLNNQARTAVLLAKESPLQNTTAMRLDDSKNGGAELEEVEEKSFHGSPTYFHMSLTAGGLMLRTAMASALNNGINNSLRNYLNKERFIPLDIPRNLLKSPASYCIGTEVSTIDQWRDIKHQEFSFDRQQDFTYVAHVIDYDNRINKAFGDAETKHYFER